MATVKGIERIFQALSLVHKGRDYQQTNRTDSGIGCLATLCAVRNALVTKMVAKQELDFVKEQLP